MVALNQQEIENANLHGGRIERAITKNGAPEVVRTKSFTLHLSQFLASQNYQ